MRDIQKLIEKVKAFIEEKESVKGGALTDDDFIDEEAPCGSKPEIIIEGEYTYWRIDGTLYLDRSDEQLITNATTFNQLLRILASNPDVVANAEVEADEKADEEKEAELHEKLGDDYELVFDKKKVDQGKPRRPGARQLRTVMFGVPVVKHGVNGELRQKGKVAELACGYSGSTGALISMGALDMGLSEEELPDLINDWRSSNPKIVQFWWDIEKAAIESIKDHKDRQVGRIGVSFSNNTLWLQLPSRRRLAYVKPKLQPNRFGRISITYEGLGQNNKWSRIETYSGKLVENITQATARDLLAEAMWRIEKAGFDIVGHVHDEVILEVPEDGVTVEDVCQIMNQNPKWADGIVLNSAGYQGGYYFKD